ncbi:NAD(P)-binding Rossmann-fold containing protein [Venustampulla echinocandica]|uniref:NAD(P)-binding Rossmann-fold containing protein n=1 Tax=Venustampulla echinocandica TaxID=2656787 RepID=A0A370TPR0_9HELO|nr:NAD(P)-binding Rossmann-fold containing protein [Venustampulla echinocandica]RDL37504.1 NAD(P)-binding Rossmann-fold containing protein [Venustampulla echinocandica]
MSIGVAIIGSGIFAKEEHLPAVQACEHLSLKAIYSRSLKSAQAINSSVDLYSDDSGSGKTYYDLLLRSDIQAVVIALPILTQPEYIEAALAAGKHVLSEKPVAKDIQSAERLIQYYKSDKVKGGATWAVAENFRYLGSFLFGAQEVKKLGRVLGFRIKMFGNVKPGGKYFETAWRKKPEYQGGFLLDGGVHFVAGTRLLLGEEARPTSLTAYTALLQEHLPPVDTVNSVWQTKSGVSGTFSVSFGTTLSGSEYVIACEKGSVTVGFKKVTVRHGEEKEDNAVVTEFSDEGSGVKEEVASWAESVASGTPNPKQSPEEALADLEILEKMLRSGEGQGKPEGLQYQI